MLAKEAGAKRAVMLPVSAPFHCSLMQPAATVMAEALSHIDIQKPKVPLVANVSAADVFAPMTIRNLLVDQVTGSVRWRESVLFMASQGVTEVLEVGAGKALCGMVRRIDRGIAIGNVADPDSLAKYLAQ